MTFADCRLLILHAHIQANLSDIQAIKSQMPCAVRKCCTLVAHLNKILIFDLSFCFLLVLKVIVACLQHTGQLLKLKPTIKIIVVLTIVIF